MEQIKAARMQQSFEMEMLKEQVPWGGLGSNKWIVGLMFAGILGILPVR